MLVGYEAVRRSVRVHAVHGTTRRAECIHSCASLDAHIDCVLVHACMCLYMLVCACMCVDCLVD